MARANAAVRLVAAEGDRSGSGPAAGWPWLKLDLDARRFAGRWIRVTYRSGLLEPLVRPVLRCLGEGTAVDRVMNAAPFGRATWLGLIPKGTNELRVSPSTRDGPCAFAIDRVEVPSATELGWALVRRSRVGWFNWTFAPVIGLKDASDVQIRRHLSPTDPARYDAWRRAGTRPLDPGFDRVADAAALPVHVRFVVRVGVDGDRAVADLASFLARQPFPNWSLATLGGGPATGMSAATGRLLPLAGDASLDDIAAGLSDGDLLAPVDPGDEMPDYAVAAFARAAADDPDASGFVADSDRVDEAGRFHSPRLRTDAVSTPFEPGPAVAVRVGALRTAAPDLRATDLSDLPVALAARGLEGLGRLRHVRRVLRSQKGAKGVEARPSRRRLGVEPSVTGGDGPRATIVIPTRDRIDLLRRCVASLRTTDGFDRVEVVVVDNGSVRRDTREFLDDLASDRRFTILPDDGPFNFSRLCNAGAARARSPALVFLNNDTEVIEPGWLDALLRWAHRPDVGAVGAKLLYPDGSVQHAGVVIGIDGLAGHFQRGVARGDAGFFGHLNVPHAVSSVTAACLAVERHKLDAVGGFDEANLPVDLNDVDLCLRLGARGWTCMLQPEAVLIHHESASRGVSLSPDVRYRTEQAIFRARWMAVIRDDPHFHPALSLDTLDARLG